jgi:hypothetical protein
MDEWLSHPAVQAGVFPFVAAFVVAIAHRRLAPLAIVVALLVAAALTVGFSLESWTATRKLVLVAALCLVPAYLPSRALAIGVVAGGVVWVLWRILQSRELAQALALGVGSIVYAGAIAQPSMNLANRRGSIAAALLAFGAAVLAVLGASVVLAQLCVAIGAGALALLAVGFLRRGSPIPSVALPVACFAAGAGVLSAVTGELAAPWLLALLPLPWLARLRWPSSLSQRQTLETR